jgi:four helix bundle protein
MARFLRIARGSASELDSHIDLSRRLGYITCEDERLLLREVIRVQRMLFGLIKNISVTLSP